MNKKVVLIVPCVFAPYLQVGSLGDNDWRKSVIQTLMEFDVDILTLSCVESSYLGYEKGLQREKHGIDYYLKEDGFCEYCEKIANQTTKNIVEMEKGGYQILIIIGIEHSPSCAVNYIYTHKGTVKRPGIFMKFLRDNLEIYSQNIKYVGINRKYPRKGIDEIRKILEDNFHEKKR